MGNSLSSFAKSFDWSFTFVCYRRKFQSGGNFPNYLDLIEFIEKCWYVPYESQVVAGAVFHNWENPGHRQLPKKGSLYPKVQLSEDYPLWPYLIFWLVNLRTGVTFPFPKALDQLTMDFLPIILQTRSQRHLFNFENTNRTTQKILLPFLPTIANTNDYLFSSLPGAPPPPQD